MATVISSPLTYLAIVVVLGYYGYRQFAVWSARCQMINQYGCKPPPNYDDNSHSWLPSFYNMKQIRFLKHYGPRNELQKATHERFLEYGLTHSSKVSICSDVA